jgi:hypothetical protein
MNAICMGNIRNGPTGKTLILLLRNKHKHTKLECAVPVIHQFTISKIPAVNKKQVTFVMRKSQSFVYLTTEYDT